MNNWIKVSDRLPDIDEKVLTLHGESIDVLRYDGYKWRQGYDVFTPPSHWQPLPDLPNRN